MIILNDDFKDFIKAFNNAGVQYIIVGGYAVILHGYNRTTGDIDIWVKKAESNYQLIVRAFNDFKMPLFDMTLENFMTNPDMDVFTYGRPPVSIDIMTSVKGLDFNRSYERSNIVEVNGLMIRIIDHNDLLLSKKASNRPKDQDDIDHLT
ncbi:nucleotidyltransferase [Bacteroidota bacterium]